MPISRFMLFSSSNRRFTHQALSLLQRSVPSKTTQSVSFTKSTRHCKGKQDVHPILPAETHSKASRSWGTYVVPAAVLGFAGIAAFFHYNDEKRAVAKGHQGKNDRSGNIVNGPIIGGPFTLINTEKQTVTEESKKNLKILPVFVTIDPQRDTPSHLRAYLKEFDSRIIGLTGPVAAIRQMAQEYRVYFKRVEEDGGDYLVDCSHNMYLLNPNMEVVRCFGVEYNAEELSESIWKELNRKPS